MEFAWMFQLVEIMWQQICTIIDPPLLLQCVLKKCHSNKNLNGISKLNIIVVFCYVYVYTSIAVNLKNIHQRITEILPSDLNHHFSLFPNFIKMQQPGPVIQSWISTNPGLKFSPIF